MTPYAVHIPEAVSLPLHQLVTVKKAATALGVDKDVIRNMIDIGAIRGERRMIKNKEKWFVYETEFQEMLDERLSQKSERVTLDGLTEFFSPEQNANPITSASATEVVGDGIKSDAGSGACMDFSPLESSAETSNEFGSELSSKHSSTELPGFAEAESIVVTEVGEDEEDHPDRLYLQPEQFSVDQMLNSLTIEFANRLCEERQIICNLQQQLIEKNELLSNLPDLKQKVEEDTDVIRKKDAEISALKSNISALEKDLSWWRKPWWSRLFGTPKEA